LATANVTICQTVAAEGLAGRMKKFKSADELLNAAIIGKMHAWELYTRAERKRRLEIETT